MGRAAPPPRILCSPPARQPAEKGTHVTQPRSPDEQRILVIIPTYNESENVERIVAAPGQRFPRPTS